jgi:predicted site-specific integrase-resolvase
VSCSDSTSAHGVHVPGDRYIYARVSSSKQKDDLERQVQSLSAQFPEHRVLRDVGSGINWKRPGLRTLVQACLRGSLREVVVAHRDRLSRLGFDLLEYIIQQSGAELVVVGGGETCGLTSEQELGEDLLSIVHVFSSRHYGMRKYRTAAPKRRRGAGGGGVRVTTGATPTPAEEAEDRQDQEQDQDHAPGGGEPAAALQEDPSDTD